MLIPLPGGHFADPRTVAAVIWNGTTVGLVFKEGRFVTLGSGPGTFGPTTHVAEVAEAINAALAPKGVEEVPPGFREQALDALRELSVNSELLSERHDIEGFAALASFARAAANKAQLLITLLESTPPKQAQPE